MLYYNVVLRGSIAIAVCDCGGYSVGARARSLSQPRRLRPACAGAARVLVAGWAHGGGRSGRSSCWSGRRRRRDAHVGLGGSLAGERILDARYGRQTVQSAVVRQGVLGYVQPFQVVFGDWS